MAIDQRKLRTYEELLIFIPPDGVLSYLRPLRREKPPAKAGHPAKPPVVRGRVVAQRRSTAPLADLAQATTTDHTSVCMPCSFGLLPRPRPKADAGADHPVRVIVAVRWIPLVTLLVARGWHGR
jgi:hypothetical protein